MPDANNKQLFYCAAASGEVAASFAQTTPHLPPTRAIRHCILTRIRCDLVQLSLSFAVIRRASNDFFSDLCSFAPRFAVIRAGI